jgi:hypothetical protein
LERSLKENQLKKSLEMTSNMLAVIAEGQLRWIGHVRRKLGNRLSWRISESEPQEKRRETHKKTD